jgi:hypothetical protein
MGHPTPKLRELWKAYECAEDKMIRIPFGPDKIKVASPTVEAWRALSAVFRHHAYVIRTADTDSYNCRTIKGSTEKSLHSFGIALDVNWSTNPFRDHAGNRDVRFSTKGTQHERAEDVRLGRADTDMTPPMIADVVGIKTLVGAQVFEWGGHWKSVKDAMHFELDLSPAELAEGIDYLTVVGWEAFLADLREGAPTGSIPPPDMRERHVVVARSGLNLRAGASTDFSVLRNLPPGTAVFVIGRTAAWAQVDLEGDGLADGYVAYEFLRRDLESPAPGITSV